MALVAEQEREAVSRRTREALAAAKARGVRLGNPTQRRSGSWTGRTAAPRSLAPNADRKAEDLLAVVEDIRAGGAISLRAIAAQFSARGILTRRGGRWHVSTVMNLLWRLDTAAG